ncbi:MAG: Ppx/GppA phosphatase family protein [Gemmatimonadales bacterium]
MTLPSPTARERLAAIDVGSNSIRLVVAEHDPVAGLSIIDEVKDQPRLARGLAATGVLDDLAMARALETLDRMREVCERRGVKRISAVATSAVREAKNGALFLDRVQKRLGLPLRVIDADEEARLSFRSVARHFRLELGRSVVADIGGGSLELVSAMKGVIQRKLSLPWGAVRLTERFELGGHTARKHVDALRAEVRKTLRKTLPSREWDGGTVIGSGGTFTNLARMAIARRTGVVPETVHGTVVTASEVEQLLEWLIELGPERRRQVAGLAAHRADIIVAGLAVTIELLERLGAREVAVSAYGLREGLLLEMVGADTPAPAAHDPLQLAREFVERCQGDRRHVEQVRRLALQLFEQLGEKIGCARAERSLLEYAALLHDVGQLVSYRGHHKHSAQLILNADRLGFNAHDRVLVAQISRYHRKAGPSKKHEAFAALSPDDQGVVRRLSALLRVADGLDRGHTSAVETIRTRLTSDSLSISVAPRLARADLGLEVWAAGRKSDVLAKVLKREVVVKMVNGKR